MKRELKQTADGSSTLYVPVLNEHYHSTHGAIQESSHIFIGYGLNATSAKSVSILEVGFGTGLNAWLTALEAETTERQVSFTSLEKYPLTTEEVGLLNYPEKAETPEANQLFKNLHEVEWEKEIRLTPYFSLQKLACDVLTFSPSKTFDVIYFDAFAPDVQPELWSVDVFQEMFYLLKPGGILVTYCAQGQVKRNMKAAGFRVEGLPGPPGKREVTRALKVIK